MKKTFYTLVMLLLATLCLPSCSEDKDDYDDFELYGVICSSRIFDSIEMRCHQLDEDGSCYQCEEPTAPCKSYDRLVFTLETKYKSHDATIPNPAYDYYLKSIYKLGQETLGPLEEDFRNYLGEQEKEGVPYKRYYTPFWTMYINGHVTITCNKPLFGKAAGEDLSSHFSVTFTSNQCTLAGVVGMESPRYLYHWGDALPSDLDEFFAQDSWMQHEYRLQFKDIPEEQYEELTLGIDIPVKDAKWDEYFEAQRQGNTPSLKVEETSVKAKCKVKFDWQ